MSKHKEIVTELYKGAKEQAEVQRVKARTKVSFLTRKWREFKAIPWIDKITGLGYAIIAVPVVALISVLSVIVDHKKAEDEAWD